MKFFYLKYSFSANFTFLLTLLSEAAALPLPPTPSMQFAVNSVQHEMRTGCENSICCHFLAGEGGGWYCIRRENKCSTRTPSKGFTSVGHTAHMHIIYILSSNSVLFDFTGQNLCSCFWCMLDTARCYTITQDLKSGHKNCQYHVVSLCQRKNQHWFHIDTLRKTVHADQVIQVRLQLQLITSSISTQSQVSRVRFCCD